MPLREYSQVTLFPELVHVMRHDLARGADVLRQQLVRERRHAGRSIVSARPLTVGKTDERASQTPRDIVHRQALDALREIDRALCQDLQQRHRQARPLCDHVLDFRGRPGHQPGVVESSGLFGPVWKIQESRFTEELVGLVDVHHYLAAVIPHPRDLHFPLDHEIDAGGRLVLVVDKLTLLELRDARARQKRKWVFQCFLRCHPCNAGCH